MLRGFPIALDPGVARILDRQPIQHPDSALAVAIFDQVGRILPSLGNGSFLPPAASLFFVLPAELLQVPRRGLYVALNARLVLEVLEHVGQNRHGIAVQAFGP